jgi:squalene-hopene/tetraprenyl-beta-curcumene cyclase
MYKEELEQRINELGRGLVSDLKPEGYWEGRLSSSALGVAVAVAALCFDDRMVHAREIERGLNWLSSNINLDGSFGDTPESPGNVSTSLLVYATVNLFRDKEEWVHSFQERIAGYLASQKIDVHSPQLAEAILNYYKKDYTFSVPILAMCGLCGVPGEEAFKHIPQLPFELSLLPRRFYRMLNLSVVSYAIPALVAVGIVIFRKKSSGLFWRFVRRFSIPKALKVLHRMVPKSGGFLEAVPLTAFVALSLINAGYAELEVVKKGIRFLKATQREDGGWPIDVDLSIWVTSLAVKSFRSCLPGFLNSDLQDKIADHFKLNQNDKVHPFNGTRPGGWGWTNHPGAVPDGDDTPGAILALMQLQPKMMVKKEILAACNWLVFLQNKDGGFPTFSRGWGKLPFDQSCSDLTGHSLLAISAALENYQSELSRWKKRKLKKAVGKALFYLEYHQKEDGSWLPLWFGNQQVPGHVNPVYGTAKVLTYLKDAVSFEWIPDELKQRINLLIEKGGRFLISVQNSDGSWGGAKNITGTMEETALAVSALMAKENRKICEAGLKWLNLFYLENGLKSAPIGLYFASLWYDEKMYPVTAYMEALCRSLEVLDSRGHQLS